MTSSKLVHHTPSDGQYGMVLQPNNFWMTWPSHHPADSGVHKWSNQFLQSYLLSQPGAQGAHSKARRKTDTTWKICFSLWSSGAATRQMKSGSSFACVDNRWRFNRCRCCRTLGLCLHCTVQKAYLSSSIWIPKHTAAAAHIDCRNSDQYHENSATGSKRKSAINLKSQCRKLQHWIII